MRNVIKLRGLAPHGRRMIFCLLALSSFAYANGENFFNFADFKTSSEVTIPAEDSEKKRALSGKTGLRLSFSDADFRGYATLPKTEFKAIEEKQSIAEKIDLLEPLRFGAGITFFKNVFPVNIKIGHNTYSKSVSKMRNPSPSQTANPVAKSFSFSSGTGANLPTLTSSKQALSCAMSIKNDDKIFPILFSAEGFLNEDKEGAIVFSARYNLNRATFFQSSLSVGRFYIENTSSILKKNNSEFDPNFFYVGLAETAFHTPLFKLNFYSGIHESPYKTNSFWFKLDGRTSFRNLLLNFSYFAIPSTKDSPKAVPLIGGSSSICRTIEQAGVNPQIIFLFDDKYSSALRLGFSALNCWKVTATNTPVQLNTAKLRTGTCYENSFWNVKFEWTRANILISGEAPTKSSQPEEYYSYSLSSSYAGKWSKTSVSGSYTRYPPLRNTDSLKEIYSMSLKTDFPQQNLCIQAGSDITMKEGAIFASDVVLGANYSIRKKFLRTSMKIEFCLHI